MKHWLNRQFALEASGTTVRREMLAGLIGFFTIVYIIAVNSLILSEAGMPLEGAIVATIVISFVAALLIGFWGNMPILFIPGMGINAMFSYTFVASMGLSWQEALGVVFVSGVIFAAVAFTKFADLLNAAIPHSIKEAISVGLGMFLILLGLEKGGVVVRGEGSILAIGSMDNPLVLATALTFLVALVLFIRNVPGNFLITVVVGTGIGALFGIVHLGDQTPFALSDYGSVFGAMSFGAIGDISFWIAVFALTLVLVFENIGLVHGHTNFIEHPERYKKSFQTTALAALLSGVFGSSPTVASVESASGMAAGGRTGLTAIVAGVFMLISVFFIPFIKLIPDSAIAPILLIIGGLMLQNVRNLDLHDLTESFPAFFIIAMIPFTYSIADGMAVGFILYPLLKVATGRRAEVTPLLYVIAALFVVYFVVK